MRIEAVRNIAKSHGIKAGKLSKTELIKEIQTEEGNFDCFGTALNGACDQANCLWREDCFGASSD